MFSRVLIGDHFITVMKIFLILSVCFVVALSDPKDSTAAVSTVGLSLIPPGSSITLAIVPHNDKEDYKMATTTMTNLVVEDDATKLRRSYLECVDETKIKIERVVKFKAGSWTEHPSLSKWALCVLVKVGLMSPQGVYRYDTAMSKIHYSDRNKVDKILNRCLTWKSLPPQKIAWHYLKCFSKEDRKKEFPFLSLFYTLK